MSLNIVGCAAAVSLEKACVVLLPVVLMREPKGGRALAVFSLLYVLFAYLSPLSKLAIVVSTAYGLVKQPTKILNA